MRELDRPSLRVAFKDKRTDINLLANRFLTNRRVEPAYAFSPTGGLINIPLINLGMGIWMITIDSALRDTASYIADLTGGRSRRDSLWSDLGYWASVVKEAGTVILKGSVVWGLD